MRVKQAKMGEAKLPVEEDCSANDAGGSQKQEVTVVRAVGVIWSIKRRGFVYGKIVGVETESKKGLVKKYIR